MHRPQSFITQALLHKSCWMYRIGVALLLFTVLLSLYAVTGSTASADDIPGGNVTDTSVRAVDIAKPAVVRIFTTVNSHLLVSFPTGTISFPLSGNGYQLQLSGSGTFISAHGDILTADHVVNPPARDPAISQAFDDSAAQDVTDYVNQHNIYGSQQTRDQIDQALRSGQIQSQPKYDSVASEVFLSTDYTGSLSATDLQSTPTDIHAPVDKIEQESSFDQKDVAIVHAQFDDTPSVQLGDSSNVQQQDQLKIIGFPGNGDVSNSPTNLLTSSVNIINVSSIKTTNNGAQVIQVGGNVEHGDSGGPALDNAGNVVGIVSFGISSNNSPGGTSFLQASNSARELVQKQGLDTTPGAFQKLWNQAFTDYGMTTAGHWHKAQSELQQLATRYPLFKAVTPYLTYATKQAKTEPIAATQATPQARSTATATPIAVSGSSLSALAITVGAILLVLALVVVLFRMVIRRGRPRTVPPKVQTGPIVAPLQGNVQRVNMGAPIPTSQNGVLPQGTQGPPSMATRAQGPNIPGSSLATTGQTPAISQVLRPWPCGHVNRPEARFCTVCGEPAPLRPVRPPIRPVEQ